MAELIIKDNKKKTRPQMKELSKDRLIVESSPEFGEWAEPSALPLSSMRCRLSHT